VRSHRLCSSNLSKGVPVIHFGSRAVGNSDANSAERGLVPASRHPVGARGTRRYASAFLVLIWGSEPL
jgi:hypothetical protein